MERNFPSKRDSAARHMPKQTATESGFATTAKAEAHDAWVRSKVERALASKLPAVPHDQVMAEVLDIINAKRRTASFPARRRMEPFNTLNKKG